MNKPNTKVMLKGGAGNQLFQYALALLLRKRRGCAVSLDASYLRFRPSWGRYIRRDVALLDLDVKFVVSRGFAGFVDYLLAQKGFSPTGARIMHDGDDLQDVFCAECGAVICDGYWQDVTLVSQVKDELRESFVLRHPLSPEGQRVLGLINASARPIAIHVRRGDYVNNTQIAAMHGFLGEDYFREAIRAVMSRGAGDLFVFSDDIAWCRDHFKDLKMVFCDHIASPASSELEDMYLMLQCRAFVISNSTYSWWAAYLSGCSDVVAPARWFRKTGHARLNLSVGAWAYV